MANDQPPSPLVLQAPNDPSPTQTFFYKRILRNNNNSTSEEEEKEENSDRRRRRRSEILFLEQYPEKEKRIINNKRVFGKSLSLPYESSSKTSQQIRLTQSLRLENKRRDSKVDTTPLKLNGIDSIKVYLQDEKLQRSSIYKTPTFVEDLERSLASAKTATNSCKNSESSVDEKVRFNHVTIYEFSIILGDNIGRSGPPVTVDWEHFNSTESIPIDSYEQCRCWGRRRTQQEMYLSPVLREAILRNNGYSRSEINKGHKAANIVRRQRRSTLRNLYFMPVHEKVEKAQRFVHNAATLGHAKRKERRFLRKHVPNYKSPSQSRRQTESDQSAACTESST